LDERRPFGAFSVDGGGPRSEPVDNNGHLSYFQNQGGVTRQH
jgi:hypothetical protein